MKTILEIRSLDLKAKAKVESMADDCVEELGYMAEEAVREAFTDGYQRAMSDIIGIYDNDFFTAHLVDPDKPREETRPLTIEEKAALFDRIMESALSVCLSNAEIEDFLAREEDAE